MVGRGAGWRGDGRRGRGIVEARAEGRVWGSQKDVCAPGLSPPACLTPPPQDAEREDRERWNRKKETPRSKTRMARSDVLLFAFAFLGWFVWIGGVRVSLGLRGARRSSAAAIDRGQTQPNDLNICSIVIRRRSIDCSRRPARTEAALV